LKVFKDAAVRVSKFMLCPLGKVDGQVDSRALRDNVGRQVHRISKLAPKNEEAEIMTKVSAQMTRVHQKSRSGYEIIPIFAPF